MPAAVEAPGLETPEPKVLLAGEIASVRSVLGPDIADKEIIRALSLCGNSPDRAVNALLDAPEMGAGELMSNDAVSALDSKVGVTRVKIEVGSIDGDVQESETQVKIEQLEVGSRRDGVLVTQESVKEEKPEVGFGMGYALMPEIKGKEESEMANAKGDALLSESKVKKEQTEVGSERDAVMMTVERGKAEKLDDIMEGFHEWLRKNGSEKKEQHDNLYRRDEVLKAEGKAVDQKPNLGSDKNHTPGAKKEPYDEDFIDLTKTHYAPYLNPRPISAIPPSQVTDRRLQLVLGPESTEMGEFPEEPDWFLVGRTYMTALSTCRGRKVMDAGEIVRFSFPSSERCYGGLRVSSKTAAAMSEIVRFSTKRSGEIGRLTPEWSNCLVPLVSSSKVKIQGRFVFSAVELRLMQEIVLYASFYIHSSIFTEGDKSSWKLTAPSNVDSTIQPLTKLFKLLNIKPFKRADFTPDELNTRKRSLDVKDDDESTQIVGLAKRRRGGETYPEQGKDEQAISESCLNKLIGAADVYDLEEAEPPSSLVCVLKPYQKQALFWMSELERGNYAELAAKTLHPCWNAYNIVDKTVYVNVFSGEATTQFPSAAQAARCGILADAMGLGKTVMTIALTLTKPSWKRSDDQNREVMSREGNEQWEKGSTSSVKGGTLIVCPMALLGQWKDELEAHSKPGSLSVFIHYGGDRTTNPKVITEHDVVLTTYGVLASAYKPGSQENIFHKIHWYRVVLDEAHTIKSSKTRVAQSAFALSSHCRWCLTGTPLQNSLEDLYSLLCFLHVEPWCNWDWWNKLIQKPHENGDPRGLKLVKAILKPLMLRRTKETKDKDGLPILVLPPANVQVVECEQSDAECDFYEALFQRSKVKFDQFVAQGKVLHNYASILELLLRLRQCCNHPFLVMSRGDTQQYADLDKLARRFLEGSHTDPGRSNPGPTRAYVEEVVEGIREGVVTECPICLESASDDPVLTPCAHRMCRECLLSSWRTPSGGPCPICRSPLIKADLITCPTESRFQVDVDKNWKESCKIAKLMEYLVILQKAREKSIVFSQWTGFLDLLEIPLRRKGIGFFRFDGKLTQKNRERVLKEFSENGDKLVLLMSLKAGGVGLNLTAASNVFLMDPWWNPAVEEQAIMRIHRIGQKRAVQVRRFIVKGTVEERMQLVQVRKQRMISSALTDEDVRSARIEELKMLFR